MQVDITPQEVAETLSMVSEQNLDLRTITMGISLAGCADEDMGRMCDKVYDRITTTAENLVQTADDLQDEYGIPIANKRVSVTPPFVPVVDVNTSKQNAQKKAHIA